MKWSKAINARTNKQTYVAAYGNSLTAYIEEQDEKFVAYVISQNCDNRAERMSTNVVMKAKEFDTLEDAQKACDDKVEEESIKSTNEFFDGVKKK